MPVKENETFMRSKGSSGGSNVPAMPAMTVESTPPLKSMATEPRADRLARNTRRLTRIGRPVYNSKPNGVEQRFVELLRVIYPELDEKVLMEKLPCILCMSFIFLSIFRRNDEIRRPFREHQSSIPWPQPHHSRSGFS